MADMQVRTVPLKDLQEDPQNVRVHDSKNLGAIRRSLVEFGQVEPLVVQKSSGLVIGGNGRLSVMRELGWLDVQVVELDLDGTKAKALALALNRTGELADWDYKALQQTLQLLQEEETNLVDDLGWTPEEINTLVAATWDPPQRDEGAIGPTDSEINDLSRRRFGILGLDDGDPIPMKKDQREAFNAALATARASNNFENEGAFIMELLMESGRLSRKAE